jgi:hypothetical protein
MYVLASGMKNREIERKLKLMGCIVYVILQITGCDKIDSEGFVVVDISGKFCAPRHVD